MANELDLFYWDACVLYEFCADEQADVHKKQAITDLLDENKEKRNRICTSVISHTEILPKKLGPEGERKYWSRFGSTFFFDIEVDRSVILLSREIKDFYYKDRNADGEYRMMSTGDAVHLATAIIHNATEFHTRDGKRKGGNVPLIGLAAMSPGGKICGAYDLKIVSPIARQASFDGL